LAEPRRYASAEFLIFASDAKRGPDVEAFIGSFDVTVTGLVDFYVFKQ